MRALRDRVSGVESPQRAGVPIVGTTFDPVEYPMAGALKPDRRIV